jgi:hypothetical protein
MLNRITFDALEAEAGASDREALSNATRDDSALALLVISGILDKGFSLASNPSYSFKLDGADGCERVAEALAVWLVESDPTRFYYAPGGRQDRYSVNSLETCADGFERLRSWREFILCAYVSPSKDTTPEELCEQWESDLGAIMRESSFDYGRATAAIRAYVTDNRRRLDSELRAVPMCEEEEAEEAESVCFRLYVEDMALSDPAIYAEALRREAQSFGLLELPLSGEQVAELCDSGFGVDSAYAVARAMADGASFEQAKESSK